MLCQSVSLAGAVVISDVQKQQMMSWNLVNTVDSAYKLVFPNCFPRGNTTHNLGGQLHYQNVTGYCHPPQFPAPPASQYHQQQVVSLPVNQRNFQSLYPIYGYGGQIQNRTPIPAQTVGPPISNNPTYLKGYKLQICKIFCLTYCVCRMPTGIVEVQHPQNELLSSGSQEGVEASFNQNPCRQCNMLSNTRLCFVHLYQNNILSKAIHKFFIIIFVNLYRTVLTCN